jgi:chitin synthase
MVARPSPTPQEEKKTVWVIASQIATCWAPSFLLLQCGLKTPGIQQAWREKVTLCLIIALICGIVLFFTIFLQNILCPLEEATKSGKSFESDTMDPSTLLFSLLYL